MTRLSQYFRAMTDKEMNYASYTEDGKSIHQFWYIEDGVKYGQEYYTDTDEDSNIKVKKVLDEVDSFPKVPEGTEFPRKQL